MIILYCSLKISAVLLDLKDKKKQAYRCHTGRGVPAYAEKTFSSRRTGEGKKAQEDQAHACTSWNNKGSAYEILHGYFYRDAGFQTFSLKSLKQKAMKKCENTKKLKIRIVFWL